MFGPFKAILFDLDGTLVDSMPHTVKGILGAIKEGCGQEISLDELAAKGFGKVPKDIMKIWVDSENLSKAYAFWDEWQKVFDHDHYPAYPEIESLLEGLVQKGIFIGIVTGRDRLGTERILKLHGWDQKYFPLEKVRCGDDGPKAKPEPDLLLDLMNQYRLEASSTLMVGDLPIDIEAGCRAGTKTAAVLWELPEQGEYYKTYRSFYKKVWDKWEGVPCDMRLNSPLSLLRCFD